MLGSPEAPAIFILGATGSIGSALARRLVADGCRVFLAGRNRDRLIALAAELDAPHQIVETSFSSITAAVENAVTSFGSLAGAICCTGALIQKPAHLTREDEWNMVLDATIRAAFAMVSAATKSMQTAGTGGSIVLMSSATATHGMANQEAVAAAQGAIMGLAKAAAATYRLQGIRINCVAPASPQQLATTSASSSGAVAAQATTPDSAASGNGPSRIGTIVGAAHWLLTGDSAWISGQVLSLDGELLALHR